MTLRGPQFEQVVVQFLPEVREVFAATAKRLANSKAVHSIYAARFADYDAFFEASMRTKGAAKIHNAAMALKAMADLANERLDQLEAETESRGEGQEAA
jgi:hypothetical protein